MNLKSSIISSHSFTVNGREYFPASKPIVVVCMDGSADEYLDVSIAYDRMPALKKMSIQGFRGMVRGALPSFTNVNNSSIITGVSPAVHGISGNFFYDEANNEEVMMNDAKFLRADTILAAAANAGRKVAVVTAKEKLRDILSCRLNNAIAFSAEKADSVTLDRNGIDNVEKLVGQPTPPIYSAEASLFVLRAGVALIKKGLADFLYLSLTDFMQHSYSPEAPESLHFYEAIDKEFQAMIDMEAIIGATADHGMNAKVKADGQPNVLYIEELLEHQFGKGFRVICPITDPYVKHHGALGSYVVVHVDDKSRIQSIKKWLELQPGITEVYDKEGAVHKLEQPADRTGDLVILSARDVVLGKKKTFHDLSALDSSLRSHGGRYEEMVPMIISHPLNAEYKVKAICDPRNFEIFEFTINGTN